MPNLDGSEKLSHPAYDSHEQVVRQSHKYSPENGYELAPAPEPPAAEAEKEAE